MKRSFKFQLRPTAKQVIALTECLESHRELYNAALQERRGAYDHPSRTTVWYKDQQPQLTAIRAADPDLTRWSCSSQQVTIRRLDQTFQAFFRRIRAGEKAGYPRFKGPGRFNTVMWSKDGDGCRWNSTPEHPTQTRVYFKGIGHVKVNQHRPITGRVKTISVKRERHRWYVVVSCDDVPAEPLPATGAVVGVDVGIASFLTTSDGKHVPNPRFFAEAQERIADAQRAIARKKRGSNRRRKAVARVTELHRRVRMRRMDFAHKTALDLIRAYDVIAVEALQIANMTSQVKPVPDLDHPGTFLPNGRASKAGLNCSIKDAGWGLFVKQLAYKAERAGRVVVEVNPRNTSRTCPQCEHVSGDNRVTQAVFRCVQCGHTDHADVNGAINILRAVLALQEAQAA